VISIPSNSDTRFRAPGANNVLPDDTALSQALGSFGDLLAQGLRQGQKGASMKERQTSRGFVLFVPLFSEIIFYSLMFALFFWQAQQLDCEL